MDDEQIIKLYYSREEQAITETEQKYGTFCKQMALKFLHILQDAEECVNDTYYVAWNRMPPELPRSLRTFLGGIIRNLSISRYRASRAKKRYAGIEIMLSELEDCIPACGSVEEVVDEHQLSALISDWLDSLPDIDAALFVRRYWYGDHISELAAACGCQPRQMTQRMLRLRRRLKLFLEGQGVMI